MSLLPFQFPFQLAVSLFSIPEGLNIVDTRYDTVNFVDTQVKEGERNIQAAVDKSGGKVMENIFGGSASDGDIMVITSEKLYIADIYDPADPNDKQRQSFFTFHGFEYRVAGVDWWNQQLGVNVYLAKRHIQQQAQQGSVDSPFQSQENF